MLTAMAFIKLAGNIQRGVLKPFPKSQPQMTIAPNLVAGVMVQLSNQSGPKKEFSDFFDLDNEILPTVKLAQIAQPGTSLADTGSERIARLVNQGVLLPRLGDAFWDAYGNMLRVFGTQERVIELGKEVPEVELLVEL